MYEHRFTREAPDNSYLPSCTGTALTTVTVGASKRRALLYMPERARACTVAVTVLPPDGWTCEQALEQGTWRRLADEEETRDGLAVMFLEPENGGKWRLDGAPGDPEGEAAYVSAAISQVLGGCRFIHADIARFGLIGFGEGGTAAQMAAMEQPAGISSIVSVGAAPVREAFARAAGDALCEKPCFFAYPVPELGIRNRSIPMPAWIVDDPEYCAEPSGPALEYWRSTCGADAEAEKAAPDVDAYVRRSEPPYPINQEREAYRVWHSVFPGCTEKLGGSLSRRFWTEQLRRIDRHPGEPEGDLRIHRDPVRDCGAEYHYQRVGGWMREWFTYVPERVRRCPERPAPLVVAIHGYGCSGEFYFNCSQWFKVADKRGFILVCPSGVNGGKYKLPTGETAAMAPSWNQIADPDLPDEFVFFRELVELTGREHAVDRSRVYATGHSNGSTTTHSLGLALPDVFAAIGCVGGAIPVIFRCVLERPEITGRPDMKVPVWIFGGEKEEDIMPAFPADGNTTAETIGMWLKNNGMAPVSGEGWRTGWTGRGKYLDLCFSDGERPMVRYTCVRSMPHAVTTEISFRLWDEFFSKFSRGADGEPVYDHFAGL